MSRLAEVIATTMPDGNLLGMIRADATAAQITRLRAAGANDYLTKPIDVRRFLAFVDATAPRRAEPALAPSALTLL